MKATLKTVSVLAEYDEPNGSFGEPRRIIYRTMLVCDGKWSWSASVASISSIFKQQDTGHWIVQCNGSEAGEHSAYPFTRDAILHVLSSGGLSAEEEIAP